ncbi:MAG: bifunctional folylpolyglutamate synthase/dihydrofolate synthase [Candidatus Thiodubiliella endoseptemdiera]|uniref:Dihydrofolate synthase/folylpolyglutamate synthase n=1 Tax=Candidatus Thiodubiliella endoseptemdiera TaxID=2738886 RepID=A0A853F0V8_9GAMM|nr:bifunctional folylpolyglutamate synthase/dihydrofolate synthase [Candidatus Thiodubiliella endoseptemdiera]
MGRMKTLDNWLDYQENLHTKKIDLGLERIQKVYQKLFPNGVNFKVITVAGTNGKGSTIAFIDSIYQQVNIKVASFTSPHIIQYNERFIINGVQASDAQICDAFAQIEQTRGMTSLTYFEFSTLAALLIFTHQKVAVAILEVGLGGRLDSVNVVDNDVAVISSIDIDHADYLGNTRESIGLEKAGIMRPNMPCICGDTNPPKTIVQYAQEIGALLTFVNAPYLGNIGLQGEHQKRNAALAIEAVNQLHALPFNQVSAGISNAKLVGRFQVKSKSDKTIVLDVAHNPAAVQALTDTLQCNQQPTIAIFCVLEDKNIEEMIDIISPSIDEWLLVPLNTGRAISMQNLIQKFSLLNKVKVYKDMPSALHQALNANRVKRIVIFGSFYVVTDALKVL